MKKSSTNGKYYLKYGLNQDPFPVDFVDNIVFLTPEIRQGMEDLKSRIAKDWQTLIINAPDGGGKTVISHQIETISEPGWMIGHISGNDSISKEALSLQLLHQYFPDRKFEEKAAITQIHKFLESCALNNRVPLIIIDDAHKLSDDTLAFLLELAALRYNETLFRIIMFATSEIFSILEDEEFAKDIELEYDDLDIPLLTKSQIKVYLNNRLVASGNANAFEFTEEEISDIYDSTSGLAGEINKRASALMIENLIEPGNKKTGTYAAAGIFILLVCIGAFFMLGKNDIEVESVNNDIAVAIPPARPLKELKSEVETVAANETVVEEVVQPVIVEAPKQDEAEEIVIETAEQPVIAEEIVVADVVEPVISEENEQLVAEVEQVIETESRQIPEQETSIESVSTQLNLDQARPEEEPVLLPETTIDKDSIVYNVSSPASILSGIRGPGWIKQQNANAMMLQVMSVQDIRNVEKIMEDLEPYKSDLAGYTNYTPSGRPRYLLFYGLYQSNSAANAAKSSLPDKLKEIDPWPRKVSSILSEIEKVQSRNDIIWY